jgi:hypothetical protein
VRIEVSHQLDLDEVIARMQSLTAYWREKYDIESRWARTVSNLAGSFLGRTFKATLSVEPQMVALEGPDPSIFLRRQAISYVTRKLYEYLRTETSRS